MPEQVVMPRLSDTMTEGTISKWLKQLGEDVHKGEPLVEIETDKANIELEAYASGKLAKVLLREGQSAPVGQLIGEIALPGDVASDLVAEGAPPTAAVSGGTPATTELPGGAVAVTDERRPERAREQAESGPVPDLEQYPAAGPSAAGGRARAVTGAAPSAPAAAPSAGEDGRLRASPMARRLARELVVDLASIQGTGPLGRIQKEDVEAAARAASPSPRPAGEESGVSQATTPDTELIALSRMQQTIVRRMVEAKAPVPHFYVSMDADMDQALQVLDGLNDGVAQEERITINDLFIRACAVTLHEYPSVNSFYKDGHVQRNNRVHVGFAVAVPDGLLVPVVRDADRKNPRQIALEARSLVSKMREGKAEPADYEGGTFSISNLGMYGVSQFGAIINPPQSGILAVGAVQERPVVRDGHLAVGREATMTLSADHRVFYGAQAAEFLRALKAHLEKPLSLIL
ncbi:MAG: dihydrolipoamide acetyltransferase family protein [Chloroflexota bacterium]